MYLCMSSIFALFAHPPLDLSIVAGSWHVLFAVLCEEFENARLVWNESTLRHLYDCLQEACRRLDMQRAVRFVHLLILSPSIFIFLSRTFLSLPLSFCLSLLPYNVGFFCFSFLREMFYFMNNIFISIHSCFLNSTIVHLSLFCFSSCMNYLYNSYQSWDIRSIDVTYPLYSTPQYLCVRGAFLPQLIDELEAQGRSCFLDDPHGILWAILDRTTMEVERVVIMLAELIDESIPRNGIICDDIFIPENQYENKSSIKKNSSEIENNIPVKINTKTYHNNSMKDFLICLKAMQLLLARYHPELHRVTPIYALCGILKKGVMAISAISKFSRTVRQKCIEYKKKIGSPILDIKSQKVENSDSKNDMDNDDNDNNSNNNNNSNNDNNDDDNKFGEKIEKIEEIEDNIYQWVDTILSVLQNRLSGPISRDDWSDFVTAGGADSLCILLTSQLFITSKIDEDGVINMIDRSNSLSEPRQDNTDGNQRRNPLSEKSAEYSALQLSNCKMKARRTREKEVELLVLSSQILQNLVLSSSSKYATVRTCSNFLFSRALSCSCLLLMIYQIIVILKNAMMLDNLQQ